MILRVAAWAFPALVIAGLYFQLWHVAAVRAGTGNQWYMADVSLPTPTPVLQPLTWATDTSLKAYWNMDQSSLPATSGGSCGSTCNLAANEGTATFNSTTRIMGNSIDLAVDKDVACASCGGVNWSAPTNGTWTMTGFFRPNVNNAVKYWIDAHITNGGFELSRSASNGRTIMDWYGTSANMFAGGNVLNAWSFIACTVSGNGGTGTCYAYPETANSGCTAANTPWPCCGGVGTGTCSSARTSGGASVTSSYAQPDPTDKFYLGVLSTGASEQPGNVDDLAIWGGIILGPQTLCRLCSCGVVGYDADADGGADAGDGLCSCMSNADCTAPSTPDACCSGSGTGSCDGTQYKNKGRNALCDAGCTLPACNAPAPSTS